MKKIIYFIVTLLIFSSCSSTYFYSTLSTTNEYVEKVENGDFLLETDSLWIAYCFKGESAPVQITVFNKLDKPLYVDWQRSALIINSLAYSYTGNKLKFQGTSQNITESYSVLLGQRTSYSNGDFGGIVETPKHVSFIPPKTMISHIPLKLDLNFDNIDKKLYKNGHMANKENEAIKVKRIDFDETNSPLLFKSYLTMYAIAEEPMTFEQSFYLSNLLKTNEVSPKNLPVNMHDRGDLFYLEKPANTPFLDVFLGTTLVIGVVALDVALDPDNRY